jgi:hypothetical protein
MLWVFNTLHTVGEDVAVEKIMSKLEYNNRLVEVGESANKIFSDMHLEFSNGTVIDMKNPYRVSIVTGDSGTGKTYIGKLIDSIHEMPKQIISSSVPVENIEFWRCDADTDYGTTGKLVIIDRYPMYKSIADMNKFIADSDNKLLIMCHGMPDDFPVNYCGIYKVKTLDYKHFEIVRYLG